MSYLNPVRLHFSRKFQTYTALLNALQANVDGNPSQLDVAIGLMYTLEAQQLMATPIPGMTKGNAGPRRVSWQATRRVSADDAPRHRSRID